MKCILASVFLAFAIISSAEGDITKQLKFIFYSKKPNTEKSYGVADFSLILSNSKFDKTKPTVFFFYGFSQSATTDKVKKVKDAYLENGGYNFIIVSINVLLYNVLNAKAIGENTVEAIEKFVDAGYDMSKVEIVGFSLGAQIGAFTARSITNFPRLTGLDPGQLEDMPIFGNPVDKAISSSDATFVMTVHTEKRSFGDAGSVGHLNAWFNGAERQPMCRLPLLGIEDRACSHTQALLFWAEGVRTNSTTVFPARSCSSYEEFKANNCDASTPIGYINAKTPNTLSGNYYLNTYKTSPYSKTTADP